jgi:hypothetical protein
LLLGKCPKVLYYFFYQYWLSSKLPQITAQANWHIFCVFFKISAKTYLKFPCLFRNKLLGLFIQPPENTSFRADKHSEPYLKPVLLRLDYRKKLPILAAKLLYPQRTVVGVGNHRRCKLLNPTFILQYHLFLQSIRRPRR